MAIFNPKSSDKLAFRTQDVSGGYSVLSTDMFKTLEVSGTAASITLGNAVAEQWLMFRNTTGNAYTFTSSDVIRSDGESAPSADDGKKISNKSGTTIGAYYDGSEWWLTGKLLA